jgi:hypothetical protein
LTSRPVDPQPYPFVPLPQTPGIVRHGLNSNFSLLPGPVPFRHGLGDLTTSAGGASAARFEVHRGAPFLSGVRFDAVFRAVGSDGTELRSDCLTVTVK